MNRTTVRVELARGHLLYGEWLRRQGRRIDSRVQLGRAFELFTQMGIASFAYRTERELLATGTRTRRRTAETAVHLTAQEARIAQMARDHLSNREIGARLFISPRTVEHHLRNVFMKLAVTSRHQLDDALDTLGWRGGRHPAR